jgi:hypothetical protein
MNANDHTLPILGQEDTEPWGIPELGPTTLLSFLGCEQSPLFEDVGPRLSASIEGSVKFLGTPPEVPLQAIWAQVLQVEGQPFPFVIWSEPVTRESFQVPPFAESSRWMIGMQALLDPAAPLNSWRLMTGLLGTAASDALALLDVETEQWFTGQEFTDRLVGPDSAPEESMLFRIDVASTTETPEEDDTVWLRTIGLHRCGRPELEMLEVPGDRIRIAHDLIEAVSSLCLLRGCPDPGFPFEAGVNVAISLQPLEEQLELLSEASVGTRQHRATMGGSDDQNNPLLNGRAVVCGPQPRGRYRQIHAWPQEAIESLLRGEGGLERTENWTRSISIEAQRRWSFLLDGIKKGLSAEVCVAVAAEDGGREQVWVDLEFADEGELRGRLITKPSTISHQQGSELTAPLEDVIDWRLLQDEQP